MAEIQKPSKPLDVNGISFYPLTEASQVVVGAGRLEGKLTEIDASITNANGNIAKKADKAVTMTVSVAPGDFSESGTGFSATKTVRGITANDVPFIDCDVSASSDETAKNRLASFACVSYIKTGSDNITIKCLNKKPENAFTLRLTLYR